MIVMLLLVIVNVEKEGLWHNASVTLAHLIHTWFIFNTVSSFIVACYETENVLPLCCIKLNLVSKGFNCLVFSFIF